MRETSPHLLKKRDESHPLLVYDYAIGGHTVDGVRQQVRMKYLRSLGGKPDSAPWTEQDSLFGELNDMGNEVHRFLSVLYCYSNMGWYQRLRVRTQI